MALERAHDGAGGRGRRALLLGPARLGQLRAVAALAALSLAAGGCAAGTGAATDAGSGTAGRAAGAPRHGGHHARIAGVTDGDTITLSGAGRTRIIGVDTPEVHGGVECYGRAASAFTRSVLTTGRRVEYRVGRETHDRYGRTLAYVWLEDGTFFNLLLAQRGYATPLTIPPNDDYAGLFVNAARRAREGRRGLWSSSVCTGRNAASLAPPSARPRGGCRRFRSHAEAQAWWQRNGRPRGYDGDRDGQVCESLP